MLQSIVDFLNEYMWSSAMTLISMGIAIYYSVAMRFPQIRHLGGMIGSVRGGASEQGITPFQAFAMALGGRIGIGAIAGVATAIYYGGPGSVFWMWVYAFLGSATAMGESVLAQIWKEDVGGEYRGGPAYYLKKTALPWLGPIFMAVGIGTYGFTGPTIQAFNIAESAHNAFGFNKTVMGVLMAVFFGIVVLGGMRRIGRFAEYVVPFMAGVFMLLTITILVLNHARIPGMIALIVKSALNMEAAYGGIFGSAVSWGIRRAIYSSEAGMGSGAHAAASSEVPHPIKQGLAQASSVYYTLIICTCTALMILCTGMYNVADGMGGHIVQGAHGIAPGIGYTQASIDTLSPGTPVGSIFIAVAIFFFAFTTLLSFGFYAAVNIAYLMGNSKYLKTVVVIVGLAQMFSIYLGSTESSALAWGIADVGVALGAWVNLLGMIFLGGVCAKCMRDYDNQVKQGLTPVFRPRELGIEGADLWYDIVEKHYKNINDKPVSSSEK